MLSMTWPWATKRSFQPRRLPTRLLAKWVAQERCVKLGGEVGYRLLGKADAPNKKGGYLKLGLYADVGEDYTSAHLQFGSGWKF